MSERVRNVLLRSVLLALPVVLVGGLALAFIQQPEPAREVVLVAEGMVFQLPGDPTPNPTLTAAPGERLRFVLVNQDRGYEHDLRLPSLSAATPLIPGDGGRSELMITAPTRTGDYDYLCSTHAAMMRGTLRVR
ncbi:MAG: hypothetical protein ACRD2Z_02635 [Thermoanaerobaculia bacterium]